MKKNIFLVFLFSSIFISLISVSALSYSNPTPNLAASKDNYSFRLCDPNLKDSPQELQFYVGDSKHVLKIEKMYTVDSVCPLIPPGTPISFQGYKYNGNYCSVGGENGIRLIEDENKRVFITHPTTGWVTGISADGNSMFTSFSIDSKVFGRFGGGLSEKGLVDLAKNTENQQMSDYQLSKGWPGSSHVGGINVEVGKLPLSQQKGGSNCLDLYINGEKAIETLSYAAIKIGPMLLIEDIPMKFPESVTESYNYKKDFFNVRFGKVKDSNTYQLKFDANVNGKSDQKFVGFTLADIQKGKEWFISPEDKSKIYPIKVSKMLLPSLTLVQKDGGGSDFQLDELREYIMPLAASVFNKIEESGSMKPILATLLELSISPVVCSEEQKGGVKTIGETEFLCYSSAKENKWIECGSSSKASSGSYDVPKYYCQENKWNTCSSTENNGKMTQDTKRYCDGTQWKSCDYTSAGISNSGKLYCSSKRGFWEECGGANEGKASSDSKYYCSKGKSVWEKCSSGLSSSLSSDKKAVCKNWKWEGVTMIGGIAPVVAKPKGPGGTGVQPKVSTEQVEAELGQATGGVGEAAPSKPVVDLNGDGKVNKDDLDWIKKNPAQMWTEKLNSDIKNLNKLIKAMKDQWS